MSAIFYSLENYKYFDSAYSALGAGSDGKIYFGLCSHFPGKNAGLFSFNPKTSEINFLIDIGEKLETGKDKLTHGKIHTPIIEGDPGRLYFGTHFSYPFGKPKKIEYDGGHLIEYDTKNNKFIDHGLLSKNEGIITITMDKKRQLIYLLTVPSGFFYKYDMNNSDLQYLGAIPNKGSICRTLTLDQEGNVYGSYENNGVFIYKNSNSTLEFIDNLLPDVEAPEWGSASRGGVNKIGRKLWRCAVYHNNSNKIYGLLASNSNIVEIDPGNLKSKHGVCMLPKNLMGRKNNVYPTLSMVLGKDKIYYFPAAGLFDYSRSENISEWTHMISLELGSRKKVDYGIIYDKISNEKIYGVAAGLYSNNEIYLLGAVSKSEPAVKAEKRSMFTIQNKQFNLSLIRIKL